MDSGLEIGFSKYLFGKDVPRNGVIANIYALDPRKHSNSERNIVIPIGFSENIKRVALKPGRYLVEVILPSGDIISQEAQTFHDKWSKVILQAENSAHEWHSWPNLLGNVPAASRYYASSRTKQGAKYVVRLIREPSPELQSGSPQAVDVWGRWHATVLDVPMEQHTPAEQDETSQLHSFKMNYGTNFGANLEENVPRWYVLVASRNLQYLLSVPNPWFSMEGNEIPSELFISQSSGGSIASSWVIQDPDFGTVLGYLANGAFTDAFIVGSQGKALDLLVRKYKNPVGAAAGGYVLIGSMRLHKTQDWYEWIENLRRDFKWLPDGAILSAWISLKKAEPNYSEARDALFEAYDRGLPYYSLGLQWLVDGLTLLADRDSEAAQRLRMVQPVAWCANMSNLFTALDLPAARLAMSNQK